MCGPSNRTALAATSGSKRRVSLLPFRWLISTSPRRATSPYKNSKFSPAPSSNCSECNPSILYFFPGGVNSGVSLRAINPLWRCVLTAPSLSRIASARRRPHSVRPASSHRLALRVLKLSGQSASCSGLEVTYQWAYPRAVSTTQATLALGSAMIDVLVLFTALTSHRLPVPCRQTKGARASQ